MSTDTASPSPTYVISVGALGLALPVTATFALPLSAYYLFLQTRVVAHRLRTRTALAQSAGAPNDPLAVACRAQANFAENVPLALLLAGLVELNGGSKRVLTYALAGLTVFRVLHAEAGLMLKNAIGPGRGIGYYGTQGLVAGLAGYAAWLVKAYWGF